MIFTTAAASVAAAAFAASTAAAAAADRPELACYLVMENDVLSVN